jgi:hypothetical protein
MISDNLAKMIKTSPDFSSQNIYFERSVQNFKRPSFFIILQNLVNEKRMKNDYFQTFDYTISWFPSLEEPYFREKCEQTGEKLLEILRMCEIIQEDTGEIVNIWIYNLSQNIEDDHLTIIFSLKAKMVWQDPNPAPNIEEIEEINETITFK